MSDLKVDGIIASTGTNTALTLQGKGSGVVTIGDGNLKFPDADGSANEMIITNGSAQLSFTAQPTSGSWAFVSTTAISDDATFDSTGLAAGYDYRFVLDNYQPATDETSVYIRIGTGGTPTWIAANYGYINIPVGNASDAVADVIAEGQAQINVHNGGADCGTGALEFCMVDALIYNPNSTGLKQIHYSVGTMDDKDASITAVRGFGHYAAATTAITAFRFLSESGNMASGTVTVYRRNRTA